MPFIPGPLRLYLPHHDVPPWMADLLSYAEAERHLHRLNRTSCGCYKYLGFNSRVHIKVQLPSGKTREEKGARVMCLLREDRPLRAGEYACHSCNDERCMNPDHLYAGSHRTNVRDRFRPGRPIRERLTPRWYDADLYRIEHTGPPYADFGETIAERTARIGVQLMQRRAEIEARLSR